MKGRVATLMFLSLLLFAVGCGSSTSSGETSLAPESERALLDPDGNIVLYVINRSPEIDPVDIEIRIDGRLACQQAFEMNSMLPDTGETFVLQLSDGQHVLSAESINGEAALETSFTVTGKHWAVLDYEYAPTTAHPPEPRQLRFIMRDEPILFD